MQRIIYGRIVLLTAKKNVAKYLNANDKYVADRSNETTLDCIDITLTFVQFIN